MKSRKKTTIWNLFFLYISLIISFANGFLIVPLYLKYIEIHLYGAWLASGNILVWITLLDPGVGDILKQKVAISYSKPDKEDLGLIITSGITISFIISSLILIAGLFASRLLPSLLDLNASINSSTLIKAFSLAVIGTAFTFFAYAFIGINQGLQSSLANGLINNLANIFGIALNIVLLLKGFGLLSIAYMSLFRGIATFLGNSIYFFTRRKREKISLNYNVKHVINFSKIFSFAFIGRIGSLLSDHIDLILVSRYLSPAIVAQLELTRRPIKFIQGFVNRPSIAFIPTIAHLAGEENNSIKVKKVFLKFIFICIWLIFPAMACFIVFNIDLIRLWVGKDIFIGEKYNFIICLTFILSSITYNISNFTFAMGNIRGNNINAFIKGILLSIALIIGAIYFKLEGIIMAPLVTITLVELTYFLYKANRLFNLNYEDRKSIIKEVSIIVFINALLILLFFNEHNARISDLIMNVSLFIFLYFALLALSSFAFREQIHNLYKGILKIF